MVPYGLGCILLALLTVPWQTDRPKRAGKMLGLVVATASFVGCDMPCYFDMIFQVILHSTAWYDPLNPNWIHVLAKQLGCSKETSKHL